MGQEDKVQLVENRRRSSNLALAVVVTATITVCLVITTAWLSTWFFLKSQIEIERMRFQFGHVTIDQQLIDDKTSKISVYDVTGIDEKVKTKILIDGKRGIQITKITTGDTEKCLVTLLAFTDQPKHLRPGQPIQNLNMNSTNKADLGKYRVENFLISDRSILEKSMLGEQGQELCDSLNAYWTYPDFTASQPNKHQAEAWKDSQHLHRDKRNTSMRKVGYWCYMDPTTCGYVTYPGDPYQRKYYKCDNKCEPYVPKKP